MVKLSKKTIGLLGGSFDPVHKGHLAISKIALKKIKLDQIYWLITKKNPFKENNYKGVKIEHIYSPQNIIGTAPANFVFDYLCLKHAIKNGIGKV